MVQDLAGWRFWGAEDGFAEAFARTIVREGQSKEEGNEQGEEDGLEGAHRGARTLHHIPAGRAIPLGKIVSWSR